MSQFIEYALYELLGRISKLQQALIETNYHEGVDAHFLHKTHELIDDLKVQTLEAVNSGDLSIPIFAQQNLLKYRSLKEEYLAIEQFRYLVLKNFRDAEQYLNALIGRIYQEIRCNHRVPLVTSANGSDNYYWARADYGLIGVPPGEERHLSNLADVYHEIGHMLMAEYQHQAYNFITGNFHKQVREYFDYELFMAEEGQKPPDLIKQLRDWKTKWLEERWLEEFACDLIATYLVGPAYAWTHLKLVISEGKPGYDLYNTASAYHPSDEARMRAIRHMLHQLGHAETVTALDEEWQQILRLQEEPYFYELAYPSDILEKLVQTVYANCQQVALLSYPEQFEATPAPISSILNEAWRQLQNNPADFHTWEKDIIWQLHQQLL